MCSSHHPRGAPPFKDVDEGEWATELQAQRGIRDKSGRPRLMSVQRAGVAGLTVADVDVRACRFMGAHNLDSLRLDECELGWTPKAWWRTARRAIAEEHHWRSSQATSNDDRTAEHKGWYGLVYQPSAGENLPPPTASQVATIYRELRKGLEDSKDEPGAADFYYGEMQMRRLAISRSHRKRDRLNTHARPVGRMTSTGEQVILTLYWLLSGYGLRAWRALAALAALVLLSGLVFAFSGYAPPDDAGLAISDLDDDGTPVFRRTEPEAPTGMGELPRSLRFSAQAATSLLRGTDVALSPVGEWLHFGLRLVGPILLGLAVLSVRGRVRR